MLTKTNSDWYRWVPYETPITQGDLILSCPVLDWKGVSDQAEVAFEARLAGLSECKQVDVVVLTQACDLQNSKVSSAIVCQHYSVQDYKSALNSQRTDQGKEPLTSREWQKFCSDVCSGYRWHLAMLNAKELGFVRTECRIVDFHKIFSIPVEFLNDFCKATRRDRLALLPPYREHLSQAFARFFMRVGLPTGIDRSCW